MRLNKLFSGAALCSLAVAGTVPRAEVVPHHEERQIGGALQCLLGGIVVLLQELLTASDATAYCQAYLGIGVKTISTTTSVTVSVTNTNFVTTGTRVFTITAPPVTNTITSIGSAVTSCLSTNGLASNGLVKRQVTATAPSAIAGLAPASISLLCVCLNPPTPSTTAIVTQTSTLTVQATVNLAASVSPTVTPTVNVTRTLASTVNFCAIPTLPPTTCSNAGLQWAYWSDPTLGFANVPGALQSAAPIATGVATVASQAGAWAASCPAGSTASFYGTTLPCQLFAFQYRGYFYAPLAGSYIFTIYYADDLVSLWVGNTDVVRSGYTADNVNAANRVGSSLTFAYTATAGQYVPVRFLLNQATGPYGQGITVTGPDGTTYLGGALAASNWVQFACDGSTQAWLPWGAE